MPPPAPSPPLWRPLRSQSAAQAGPHSHTHTPIHTYIYIHKGAYPPPLGPSPLGPSSHPLTWRSTWRPI
ncbi:hypothetical protein HanIR_Chr05g0208361 [Helianthus annuus]|nr:hypothetical protein HanIR_Chr05g0208361 [Helianthus annuus]